MMNSNSALCDFSISAFIQEVKSSLDELPTRKFSKKGKESRRGAQRLAFACIFSVAKKYDLFADAEYEIRYGSTNGKEQKGWLDAAIEEPNHFLGLLLACEIVTDKVLAKDLLKLRDAPVSERGQRLLIQLNPFEEYPITATKALLKELTDEEADSILIMRYRHGLRTLLDRRNGTKWAIKKRKEDAEEARYLL